MRATASVAQFAKAASDWERIQQGASRPLNWQFARFQIQGVSINPDGTEGFGREFIAKIGGYTEEQMTAKCFTHFADVRVLKVQRISPFWNEDQKGAKQ